MMNTPSLAEEWDDYLVAIREDAHQLLAWGYADARTMLSEAQDEYEMTGLLADKMDARINALETPERFTLYAVHNEKPTSPSGELGKKRPKLDIQIERCGIRPKRYFTFEAKRLRDDVHSSVSDTMRHYMGTEGIRRFLSSHYAQESLEAAMLGCIQAHNAEFWFSQFDNAFQADSQNANPIFALTAPLSLANVISDLPDERVSIHARIGGASIQIFHLCIDCRSEANK